MGIVKYDKDGWICRGLPSDFGVPVGEMEVNDELYHSTFGVPTHYEWRVVDGELKLERYEDTPDEEIKEERIGELKKLLADTDYQAIKYAEGRITEEEYAPISQQRQAWRDEINRLQG